MHIATWTHIYRGSTQDGQGNLVARKEGEKGQWQLTDVRAGVSLTIPFGVHFQFRNTGDVTLKFIITTMPPWPGPDEAFTVNGYWK